MDDSKTDIIIELLKQQNIQTKEILNELKNTRKDMDTLYHYLDNLHISTEM